MKKTQKQEVFDYQKEVSNNQDTFVRILKKVRPDWYVLLDLLMYTKVNPLVLYRILRQLNNIAMGTGFGQVVIVIENGVVRFVRGEEADKLNEPLILKDISDIKS